MEPLSPAAAGVSIIICVYNGASRIKETLEHLLGQQVSPEIGWEVILVDNNSTDDTVPIARQTWQSGIPMRVVHEPVKGITHARLRGIEAARYEYLSFVDDDNRVNPDWIETIYRTFSENPEIAICGGEITGEYEISPPQWFLKVKSSLAIGAQGNATGDITKSGRLLWGAGLSFRKPVFSELVRKGFRFHTQGRVGKRLGAGDDSELNMAFIAGNYRLFYIEHLKLSHFMPASRIDWLYMEKVFCGLGDSEVLLFIYRLCLRGCRFPLTALYLSVTGYSILYFGWRILTIFQNHYGSSRYLSYLARRNFIIFALQNFGNCLRITPEITRFCQNAARTQ